MAHLVGSQARTLAGCCANTLTFMQLPREIQDFGIVHGVRFRLYVHLLATDRNLGGNINNPPTGATFEVQGPTDLVEEFVS